FLGVGDLCQQILLAARPSVSNSEWMLAVAQRALDSFERTHNPNDVKVAHKAIEFSFELGDVPPGLAPLRDEYRDLIARYEAITETMAGTTVEPLPDSVSVDHPEFVGRQHFPTAWAIGHAVLLGQTGSEPSDQQIAEYLAASADLKHLCGL